MISSKALKQFQKIWEEEYREKILDKKAIEEAVNLLTLFDAVYRPIKREWSLGLESRFLQETERKNHS